MTSTDIGTIVSGTFWASAVDISHRQWLSPKVLIDPHSVATIEPVDDLSKHRTTQQNTVISSLTWQITTHFGFGTADVIERLIPEWN